MDSYMLLLNFKYSHVYEKYENHQRKPNIKSRSHPGYLITHQTTMTTILTSEMQKPKFYFLALPSDGWKTKTPIAIVWSELYNSPCIISFAIHRLRKNCTVRPNDESTRLSYSQQMTVFQNLKKLTRNGNTKKRIQRKEK